MEVLLFSLVSLLSIVGLYFWVVRPRTNAPVEPEKQ